MPQQARVPAPGLTAAAFAAWWPAHSSLQRLELLKAIQQATADLFEKELLASEPDEERRQQLRAVVLESNLGGLEEFGAEWYECIGVKMVRMVMCAEFIERSMAAAGDACGFDAYERALIVGAAKILPSYNQYYFDFLQAVQDEEVGSALKASPPPPDAEAIHSHYTILRTVATHCATLHLRRQPGEPWGLQINSGDNAVCAVTAAPAVDGGVIVGDTILKVAGQDVTGAAINAIDEERGDCLELVVRRAGAGPAAEVSESELVAVPFAAHFKEALPPILACFDEWIASCRAAEEALAGEGDPPAPKRPRTEGAVWTAEARSAYTAFLEQYRDALALDGTPAALEAAWAELDRRWMDCAMPIQLVHDIETGYGDPLRVKATPDMSLRFLDETYAEENATIADIQRRLEEWYTKRDTPLARSGLKALSSTLAGIYFIPFSTGISLQFSFSGQSIPNRQDVAAEKGIKIYFDAVETAARVEINKRLILQVFHAAPQTVLATFPPDAVEQLVWHVAAHEVGHAIYNLKGIEECFSSPSYESMLEEPRAELTAMFSIRLLHAQGVLTRAKTDMALAHFALDGLRYFDKYDSEALRPYIIFQVYAYKVYNRHGYLTVHPADGKLVLDATKTLEVLDVFVECFERLLGLMDMRDGAALEEMLFEEIAPEDAFVRKVLALVRAARQATERPERGCSCHPTWSLPKCTVCPSILASG